MTTNNEKTWAVEIIGGCLPRETPGWERNEKHTHSFENARRLAIEMIDEYVKHSLGDIVIRNDGTVAIH